MNDYHTKLRTRYASLGHNSKKYSSDYLKNHYILVGFSLQVLYPLYLLYKTDLICSSIIELIFKKLFSKVINIL